MLRVEAFDRVAPLDSRVETGAPRRQSPGSVAAVQPVSARMPASAFSAAARLRAGGSAGTFELRRFEQAARGGEVICSTIESAPADYPDRVTRFGSPPTARALALAWIQRRAAC